MNRAAILEHLAEAEEQVAIGLSHVRRQRRAIAELKDNRDPRALRQARKLLAIFEELQHLHVADRDQLVRLVRSLH